MQETGVPHGPLTSAITLAGAAAAACTVRPPLAPVTVPARHPTCACMQVTLTVQVQTCLRENAASASSVWCPVEHGMRAVSVSCCLQAETCIMHALDGGGHAVQGARLQTCHSVATPPRMMPACMPCICVHQQPLCARAARPHGHDPVQGSCPLRAVCVT